MFFFSFEEINMDKTINTNHDAIRKYTLDEAIELTGAHISCQKKRKFKNSIHNLKKKQEEVDLMCSLYFYLGL